MELIRFRSLPGVASIEERCLAADRLMKDELEELFRDVDQLSLTLFGITRADTEWHAIPSEVDPGTPDDWERHFDFLDEYEYEEEEAFWAAFGIDVSGKDGDRLECLAVLGRQLVCALKQLHPAARASWRADLPRSDKQLAAEADAWGRALTASRRA